MANNLSLARTGRITGSRIAGVLGVSPYVTRDDVLREMVREAHYAEPEFDGNVATDWGSEHEQDGVLAYELETGLNVIRQGEDQLTVVSHDEMFAVTPDGLIPNGDGEPFAGAIEVKAPFRAVYNAWWEARFYEQQCRLVSHVLGLPWTDFVVWRPTGASITRCKTDVGRGEDGDEFDFNWFGSPVREGGESVAVECERFLEEYNRVVASEELSKPYLEGMPGYRYDDEWLMFAATELDLTHEIERLEAMRERNREVGRRLSPESSAKGGGVHLVYSRPPRGGGSGNVKWKELASKELAKRAVEITAEMQDQYRGKAAAGGGRGTYSFRRLAEGKEG